jgi:hypothetical protein
MEEAEFLRDFEGIKDYRTFLVRLGQAVQVGRCCIVSLRFWRGMAFIALKISPSIHNFISKQQSAVYSKLQTEVDSLANSIKRGKICFIKNEDLNQ